MPPAYCLISFAGELKKIKGRYQFAGFHWDFMKNEFTEYVPILETHNAGDRVFLKSVLDAEGITYYIQGEYVAHYLFNALPMRLMVKKNQAEQARDILKDVELSYSYGGKRSPEDVNEE